MPIFTCPNYPFICKQPWCGGYLDVQRVLPDGGTPPYYEACVDVKGQQYCATYNGYYQQQNISLWHGNLYGIPGFGGYAGNTWYSGLPACTMDDCYAHWNTRRQGCFAPSRAMIVPSCEGWNGFGCIDPATRKPIAKWNLSDCDILNYYGSNAQMSFPGCFDAAGIPTFDNTPNECAGLDCWTYDHDFFQLAKRSIYVTVNVQPDPYRAVNGVYTLAPSAGGTEWYGQFLMGASQCCCHYATPSTFYTKILTLRIGTSCVNIGLKSLMALNASISVSCYVPAVAVDQQNSCVVQSWVAGCNQWANYQVSSSYGTIQWDKPFTMLTPDIYYKIISQSWGASGAPTMLAFENVPATMSLNPSCIVCYGNGGGPPPLMTGSISWVG